MIGFIGQIYSQSLQGIFNSFLGMIIPILILYPLFLMKVLGAGDIKVFSVIGISLGWFIAFESILVSFLVGAVIALFLLFYHKVFFTRINYVFSYLSQIIYTHKLIPYHVSERDGHKYTMHFTLAIGISLIILFIVRINKMNIWQVIY
ncbi:hypothetical protein lbkm_3267 [Lachnospiraceae bacterium KM106-2]|nr:hypothetical protein lbkm_3267 [Lachnospiraceae bacterium KM106-2]